MNPQNMIKWVSIGVVLILIAIVFFTKVSYSNKEIDLREQCKAQQDANKVIYDKVWKVIKQKAQITDKYENAFKSIYSGMMNARYEGEKQQAPLFKFVSEHHPNLSIEMYKDLSDAVEANRAEFMRVQKRLIDIKREHDVLRKKFPGSLFIGGRPELDIKLITSSKTEQVFQTGKEDDVNLF